MSFKINTSKTFKWPVKFDLVDDNGIIKKCEFKGIFKRLSRSEIITALDSAKKPVDESIADTVINLCGQAGKKAEDVKNDVLKALVNYFSLETKGTEFLDNEVTELLKIMSGWEGLEDESGDFAFNESNLRLLIDTNPPISQAIFTAFRVANNGGREEKN